MDKIVKKTLENFDQISILEEEKGIISFSLMNKEFSIIYSDDYLMPIIAIKNEENFDYPHIMISEHKLRDGHKYRMLCLIEIDRFVKYTMSFEDKIIILLEQLIKLLSLSEPEIEKEFQKEFLFYWSYQSKNTDTIEIYANPERQFQKMNVYINKDLRKKRIITRGIQLNDKHCWNFDNSIDAYFIPIIDNRGIIQPTKGNEWSKDDIIKLIKGRDIARISHDTFTKICAEKVKSRFVYLVFNMIVEGNDINFCCKLSFSNGKTDTLINKINDTISKIEIIYSKRCDFYFLNKQIGNDTSIIDKNIAVIGAGSLGSYVCTELVKSGIKNITIYDKDELEYENIMRHKLSYLYTLYPKVIGLKSSLKLIHPEVNIIAENEHITETKLEEVMNNYDLIIFTVGSSDIQLLCNKMFKSKMYNKPVIYAWLEAGGENSHILKIDYSKKGCFECLYTGEDGSLINNKANTVTDEIVESNTIRNGCGGTRVAYGNEVLLRTTSVLLDTVKNVFNNIDQDNYIIDIQPTNVVNKGNIFAERKCNCCSDKD
ncbi:MAG: ThiF family adenylyltransferase [Intestinibacter bartlettii]|nr:ThiF family adenylyltransferase [Intestinibacter bartlettii]